MLLTEWQMSNAAIEEKRTINNIITRMNCGGPQSKKYKDYSRWVKDVWAARDENKDVSKGKQWFLDNGHADDWDEFVKRFLREKD